MPAAFRSRLAWLTLFGFAFGLVEAAVVVYLRALYYPDGFHFPLILLPTRVAVIEILREAGTLVMLLAVAGLAARTPWGRFGAFALAFGVWDLAYYAGLRLALDWPDSWATWDVLFLVPGVWTGPIWSACGVALLLIICGAVILRADAGGRCPRPGLRGWGGGTLSLGLLLGAFLWNSGTVSRGVLPGWFPWPLWLAGVAVGLGTFVSLFRGSR